MSTEMKKSDLETRLSNLYFTPDTKESELVEATEIEDIFMDGRMNHQKAYEKIREWWDFAKNSYGQVRITVPDNITVGARFHEVYRKFIYALENVIYYPNSEEQDPTKIVDAIARAYIYLLFVIPKENLNMKNLDRDWYKDPNRTDFLYLSFEPNPDEHALEDAWYKLDKCRYMDDNILRETEGYTYDELIRPIFKDFETVLNALGVTQDEFGWYMYKLFFNLYYETHLPKDELFPAFPDYSYSLDLLSFRNLINYLKKNHNLRVILDALAVNDGSFLTENDTNEISNLIREKYLEVLQRP
jgi:hypothetical protein